tara:strand:+ start:541 stop:744 length:204 start_codon:yes stop_codon:yes gene_type:complete
MKKIILILVLNTDNVVFRFGASIAKFIDQGSKVCYVAFSLAEEYLPHDFYQSDQSYICPLIKFKTGL